MKAKKQEKTKDSKIESSYQDFFTQFLAKR